MGMSEFKYEMDDYMQLKKECRKKKASWLETHTNIFYLVLQPCPPELEEIIKTLKDWESVLGSKSAIELFKLVRNMSHNQVETKQLIVFYIF